MLPAGQFIEAGTSKMVRLGRRVIRYSVSYERVAQRVWLVRTYGETAGQIVRKILGS